MADEQAQQGQQAQPGNPDGLPPSFYTSVNENLALTHKQSREHGLKGTSLASLYATARFNSHVYLSTVESGLAASERVNFLDYMSTLYRRMLNEHLDSLGQERNIDVGESELAAEYAAAGVQLGRPTATPAGDGQAMPPPAPPANE